jgi:hypothetical protein
MPDSAEVRVGDKLILANDQNPQYKTEILVKKIEQDAEGKLTIHIDILQAHVTP